MTRNATAVSSSSASFVSFEAGNRFRFSRLLRWLLVLVCAAAPLFLAADSAAGQKTIDFSDLSLDAETPYYNGADAGGGFVSGGAFFTNTFTDWGDGFTSWDGFAYSSVNDPETPGFGNQYAAITGGGSSVAGSAVPGDIYAVGYWSAFSGPPQARLPERHAPVSMRVSNTAYTYWSMANGDDFSKKFGGEEGSDPDYLILHIQGMDTNGLPTGVVDYPLADFRAEDSADDYIVDSWRLVDLSPLARSTVALSFTMSSSDVGEYGINTPTFFAMDNLVVEPQLFAMAEMAEDGLKRIPWFGYFADWAYPWVYHSTLGWVYFSAESDDNIALFIDGLGWVTTGQYTYPWLYQASSGQWLYYLKDSSEPRRFWDSGANTWLDL